MRLALTLYGSSRKFDLYEEYEVVKRYSVTVIKAPFTAQRYMNLFVARTLNRIGLIGPSCSALYVGHIND